MLALFTTFASLAAATAAFFPMKDQNGSGSSTAAPSAKQTPAAADAQCTAEAASLGYSAAFGFRAYSTRTIQSVLPFTNYVTATGLAIAADRPTFINLATNPGSVANVPLNQWKMADLSNGYVGLFWTATGFTTLGTYDAGTGISNCNDQSSFTSSESMSVGTIAVGTTFGNGELILKDVQTCNSQLGMMCVTVNNAPTAAPTTAAPTTVAPTSPPGGSGDPHFVGFDGSRFNFDGQAGKVFAILSEPFLQVNAELVNLNVAGQNGTWMSSIGIMTNAHNLIYNNQRELIINNQLIKEDQELEFEGLSVSVRSNGAVVKVTTPTYAILLNARNTIEGSYINIFFSTQQMPTDPHGIVGQTARFLLNNEKPSNFVSHMNNGEDLLEGVYTDYMVADGLLGYQFTFNRFEAKEDNVVSKRASVTSVSGGRFE